MTQAKPRFTNLEDYLNYDDGTDTHYELVDGVLVEMPTESPQNLAIVMFLVSCFMQLGIPYNRLGIKYQISVNSSEVTAREPDLIVHSDASFTAVQGSTQALIRFAMPVPTLIVEVVSPGEPGSDNYDRDYIDKRHEYAARGIPEYWLIDPHRNQIIVLSLQSGRYAEIGIFRGNQPVMSPKFPQLNLIAEQVLSAG